MDRYNEKWIFLNSHKSDNREVDKLSIAEEVYAIERFANIFGSAFIISNGSDEILKTRDMVDNNESLRNECRLKRLKNKKKDTAVIQLIKNSIAK